MPIGPTGPGGPQQIPGWKEDQPTPKQILKMLDRLITEMVQVLERNPFGLKKFMEDHTKDWKKIASAVQNLFGPSSPLTTYVDQASVFWANAQYEDPDVDKGPFWTDVQAWRDQTGNLQRALEQMVGGSN